MRRAATPLVLALAALAGCGDLPQPFAHNPGRTAQRLLQPPPARLLVDAPTDAMLPHAAAMTLAVDIAHALGDRGIPAAAGTGGGGPGDWRLVITADLAGDAVTPTFAVRNPTGTAKGAIRGAAMPAAAWADARPETLQLAATQNAQAVSDLLERIEAQREESDPDSLLNRQVRVAMTGVTGAPGDGNIALDQQFRLDLPKHGLPVQDALAGSDFSVAGLVNAVPEAGGLTRVELQWVVRNAQGQELGRVVQLNEVPAGAITGLWGDAAIAAAEEAATGVQSLINKTLDGTRAAAAAKPPA